MSDEFLRLIPADPRFIPTAEGARAAGTIVANALRHADSVKIETHLTPRFIDQGANLEAVVCPACHRRLEFDGPDAMPNHEWWSAIVDPLEGLSVLDHQVAMPCCGASVPFPDLEFDWPAGVASFEISIRNPGPAGRLDAALVSKLEKALGCRVRQIWAHY